jgi:serine/threonine protein kinase
LTSDYDIKIGDFGVSLCIYEDETTQTKQTCVGTFKYMSPEIRESRKYTFNTDVW